MYFHEMKRLKKLELNPTLNKNFISGKLKKRYPKYLPLNYELRFYRGMLHRIEKDY